MNQISFEKYLTLLREFVIQFEIQPISYSKIETTIIKIISGTFIVDGTYGVSPILEIIGNGTGSISINNIVINLTGLSIIPIIIDCDLMNATQGLNSANSQIECDKFPKLKIGLNELEITGSVFEVKIRYKKGWL
jgi:phage-related protein